MKRIVWAVVLGLIVLVLVVRTVQGHMPSPFASFDGFGTWFAALLTLAIMSFLYDDNPLYRAMEARGYSLRGTNVRMVKGGGQWRSRYHIASWAG